MKKKLRGLENAPFFKRSKRQEKFSLEKYKKSIMAAGLDSEAAEKVVDEVSVDPSHYFSSAKVHQATYRALLKRSALVAANYNIVNAIYALGPSGFPFEILCAQMFQAKGFETQVGVIKKGEFINHEVDIIARRQDVNIFCEAKFHNRKMYKNDVKVPLYVYARYLDLKRGNPDDDFKYALISNTKFSLDAMTYAEGVGLTLISMNHPHKDTFIDHISRYKVYPVTILLSLKKGEKRRLLDQGVVTVKQLKREHLQEAGLQEDQIVKVMQEVKVLTRPN
ncbi:MAG: restriction endonuclease [Bacteriovoracaceae bacterium]